VADWYRFARSPLTPLVATSGVLAIAIGGLSGVNPRLGIASAFGVIFVVLVLTNLQIGFAAMVLFAFLEVLSVLGGVSLAKVTGVLIVVGWVASTSIRGRGARNFFADHAGLVYLLLSLIAWAAISVAWSESRTAALTSAMRYGLDAFLLPIGYAALRNRRDVEHILAVVVIGAAVAALSAILLPPPPESAVYGRATGTVGDPNELAAVLVVGLAVATAFAVNRHINPQLRLLSGVSAVFCLTGILVSLSRGGLIGTACALVFAIFVAGRWRKRVLALCAALAVLAVGYFAFVAAVPAQQRVLNVTREGGSGRLTLWTVGGRMVAAHPVQGVGAGQFELVSVHYLLRPGQLEGQFILSNPKVAHNTYLNVTAELGFIGGLLFVAILAVCVGCTLLALKRVREAGDERMEILICGLVVGTGGYLVTLMFISVEYAKLLWILLALGPVVLAIVSSREREGGRRASLARAH
jgi:putative inorganic carbon (hco3(-)) transporter